MNPILNRSSVTQCFKVVMLLKIGNVILFNLHTCNSSMYLEYPSPTELPLSPKVTKVAIATEKYKCPHQQLANQLEGQNLYNI